MASKKKLLQAAAGSVGGAGLDISEVFSPYLYDGTGSAQTITNNIDLSGEGGLVWIKRRDGADGGGLFDTVRGATKGNFSSSTSAEITDVNSLTSFNSNGFTLGTGYTNFAVNGNNMEHVAWTFRKAPKFFDVGTISFNSSGVGSYSHNLGVTPAMVIFKLTNTTGDWFVWHKDLTSQNYAMFLNSTAASSNQGSWATYTDTTVTFDSSLFANDTAVVYVFAHNDGDGDFGPSGDQDVIKCGSYTGNGSSTGPSVNLGFEPQWIMIKKTNSSQNAHWYVFDAMRGIVTGGDDPYLYANKSDAEVAGNVLEVTPTGFQLKTSGNGFNGSSDNYIYMAIRRGPLAAPESATDVFAIDTRTGNEPSFVASFEPDMAIKRNVSVAVNNSIAARLTGNKELVTNDTAAESSDSGFLWDYMDGWANDGSANSNVYSWMWKRAPSYFDVVAYTGDGVAGRTVSHNLGVAPEMMWVKRRSDANNWTVYHKGLDATAPEDYGIYLDDTAQRVDSVNFWNDTAPTSSVFTVGVASKTNGTTATYIAYLFASLDGISKVGSYTGNGSTQNIDCGFSSGARFVLIKRTDVSEGWKVHDSVRGIVAGNDPFIELDKTNATNSSFDLLDPYSGGFAVNNFYGWNGSGGSYIFYAIA